MGSCLWDIPRMQVLLSKFKVFRHSLSMAWFGGATQKQTWLWSSHKFISGIDKFGKRPQKHKQKELVEVWTKNGKRRFRGNSETKSSQVYPRQFGEAVASLYDEHATGLKSRARRWQQDVANNDALQACTDDLFAVLSQVRGGWEDAELDAVFSHLER